MSTYIRVFSSGECQFNIKDTGIKIYDKINREGRDSYVRENNVLMYIYIYKHLY